MKDNLLLIKQIATDLKLFGGKVFFVGGYVRDKIMSIESKDIDVEIFGIESEHLEMVLSQYGEVQTTGKSFGVYMIKGYDIDFSLPRKEKKIGDKHTDFEINIHPYMSTKSAAKRRDFTMNAIMEDVLTGELIDPFNGQIDIEEQVIRHVDEQTFIEDELRAFRACQFAARFDFDVSERTLDLCYKNFTYENLPKERIFEEFKKGLLKSKDPGDMLYYMDEAGIIDKVFPQLKGLMYCIQDKRWHAEGSVWNHTVMVLNYLARSGLREQSANPLALMFAALLHDIGKPDTRVVQDSGEVTFHRHEHVGHDMAYLFMGRLTRNKKLIDDICLLVENHMRPNQIAFTGSDKAVRKLIRDTNIYEQLLLSEADHMGRISKVEHLTYDEHKQWFQDKIKELSNGPEGVIEPLVTGKDLIALGVKPGPIYKKMLDYAMQYQLDGLNKYDILYLIDVNRSDFDD